MKALICIISHDNDQWFFEKLNHQHQAITQAEYIKTKDARRQWHKSLPAFMAFLRFGPHKIDYDAISLYNKKMLETIQALPESSTLSGRARESLIEILKTKLSKRKKRIRFLFYYFLWKMRKFDTLLIYNGNEPEQKCLIKAAKTLGKKILFFEVGPFQNTILMDSTGINYASGLPRQISFYKNWAQKNPNLVFSDANATNAPKIGTRKKAHLKFRTNAVRNLKQKYIFFPLQVFRDTQILFYGGWIKNIQHLVEVAHKAAQNLPEGWCVLTKEHPECYQRYQPEEMETDRFMFANGNETPDLIANASMVATLNSTVGLEAMLLDKPVITLGQAFYAFDGLTHQCHSAEEVFEIFKNPEQVSFNREDRYAFLSYLANDYYLNGSFYEKKFSLTGKDNEKNRRLIARNLADNKNAG